MDTDYLIIGAGLCGLTCAHLLTQAGKSVRVLEARAQAGGRIRSVVRDEDNQFVGDLGPTWIWPKYQPTARRWVEQLGLSMFDQFDQGQTLIDSGPDVSIQRYPVPGQDGSVRLVGGSSSIIDALVASLPADCIQFNAKVSAIAIDANGVTVTTGEHAITADRVICALPPRVANQIQWQPELPAQFATLLDATPTWMAPQAKVVATYDQPFWRAQGLSGRIMSRSGPVGEAHDHCSPDQAIASVFGFLAWPASMRAEHTDTLIEQIASQFERCFGQSPNEIFLQDWATEPTVTTLQDLSGPIEHPTVRPNQLRTAIGEGRLRFAVAEASVLSPGLIEGALDSAEQTVEAFLAE